MKTNATKINREYTRKGWGIVCNILFFLFLQINLVGQIVVSTTPPDGNSSLHVGYESAVYQAHIKNMEAEAIEINTVEIVPFDGVTIIDNHVVDNNGFTIPVSGNTFSINQTIAAGDSIWFSYNATAGCESVTDESVKDQITLIYMQDGTTKTITTESDSYTIRHPSLTVSSQSIKVINGETYEIITEIKNANGAGEIDDLQFTITIPDASLVSLTNTMVSESSTNFELSVAGENDGDTYTYTIHKGLLETIGFEAGKSLYVRQEIIVNSYFDVQKILYTASELIDDVVCENVSANASTTLYQEFSKPSLYWTLDSVLKNVTICDSTGVIRLRCINRSEDKGIAIGLISRLTLSTKHITIDNISSVDGTDIPFILSGTSAVLSPEEGIDYDGTGDFNDYNEDNIYMDLDAGDTSYIDVSFHISHPLLYSYFFSDNVPDVNPVAWNRLGYSMKYLGLDSTEYGESDSWIAHDRCDYEYSTLTGPSDIDPGQFYEFGFEASYDYSSASSISLFNTDKQFFLRVTVPNGFSINGEGTEIFLPLSEMGEVNRYIDINESVSIKADSNIVCDTYPVTWEFVFTQSACNSTQYTILDTYTKSFFLHSQNCASTPARVDDFTISRVNTGYNIDDSNIAVFENNIVSAEQFTEENCPNSISFIENDTMRLSLSASVPKNDSCLYTSITALFRVEVGKNFISPYAATLTVNDADYTSETFSISQNGNFEYHTVTFNLSEGLVIEDEDMLEIMVLATIVNVDNDESSLDIRSSIIGFDCDTVYSDSRGAQYTVFEEPVRYSDNSAIGGCYQSANFRHVGTSISFPSEFRPREYISMFTITKIEGFTYDFSSIILKKGDVLIESNMYTVSEDENFIYVRFPDTNRLVLNADTKYLYFRIYFSTCGVDVSGTYINDGYIIYTKDGELEDLKTSNYSVIVKDAFYTYSESSIETNNGESLEWSMMMANEGTRHANNLLEFSIDSENSSLELSKILLDSTEIEFTIFEDAYYFNVPLYSDNSVNINFILDYMSCAFNDSIQATLRTGYGCGNITPHNFEEYVCDSLEQKLIATTADLSLVQSVPSSPEGYFDFCQSIPYSVDIFLGNVDSTSISYWLSPLPPNMKIAGNTLQYEFAGFSGNIPITNLFTPDNNLVTHEILSQHWDEVDDLSQEQLTLSFNLEIECSDSIVTDITKVLSEHVSRKNICGAEKKEAFDFTPNIRGFEHLQDIYIATDEEGFDINQQANVAITTSNVHVTLIDSVSVRAIVPEGVIYLSSTDTAEMERITEEKLPDGRSVIVWAFDYGKYMQGQSEFTYNAQFKNENPCSADTAEIMFISSLNRKVTACDNEGECIVRASSDTSMVYLYRNPPAHISNINYIDEICAGDSAPFIVETISDSSTIEFNYSPEIISIGNDIIYTSPTAEGVATINIHVSDDMCSQDTTVTINVLPKETVTIDPVETVRVEDEPITLVVTPQGGTWNSPLVDNGQFDPSVVGAGTHRLIYTYAPDGYCASYDTIDIVVYDCSVEISIADTLVCNPQERIIVPVDISQITECAICDETLNISFDVEYDNTKLEYAGEYTLGGVFDPSIIHETIREEQGEINFQLYGNIQDAFVTDGGEFLTLTFDVIGSDTAHVSITNAYVNGRMETERMNASEASIVLVEPIDIVLDDTSFCVGSSIELVPEISEKNSPYTYLWSTGETTESIMPLSEGTYSLEITDAYGCSYSEQALVIEHSAPQVRLSDTSFCVGDTIELQAQITGNAPYTYSWNTNETTQSISVDAEGQYIVEVTDAHNCVAQDSNTVTHHSLPHIETSNAAFCSGESVDLAPSVQGNSPFTYMWNTGETTPNIVVDVNGNYSVEVQDANNCIAHDTISVVENQLPVIRLDDITICSGETGTITADVTGNEPFSYVWNTQETTPEIEVSNAGTYSVSIIDVNSCEANDSAMVTVIETPEVPEINAPQFIIAHTVYDANVVNPESDVTYNWTGVSVIAGVGTGSIQFSTDILPNTICVTATRDMCESEEMCSLLEESPLLDVNGSSVICKNNENDNWMTENYSISNPNPNSTYIWSVSDESLAVVNSSQGGTVSVRYLAGLGSVTILVDEYENGELVGSGEISVDVNLRPANTQISIDGPMHYPGVCANDRNVLYTIDSDKEFEWIVTGGDANLDVLENSNSAYISFGSQQVNIEIRELNGVGCASYSPYSMWIATAENNTCYDNPEVLKNGFIENEMSMNENGEIDEETAIVSIFPQPASQSVYVYSVKPVEYVMLYTHTKSLLKVFSETHHIDISQFPDGMYYLYIQIKAEDELIVKPLIIQRK